MESEPMRLRVLAIDDLVDDATVTSKLLALLGCEVATCTAPRYAVAAAQEFLPHLILLDVAMPGMSGVEVAKQLRQLDLPPFLLVARTGYTDPSTREQCYGAGFNLVMLKPVSLSKLKRLLESVRKFEFA